MRLSVLSLALTGLLAAAEDISAVRPWLPAGPKDSRGPCPMLNTLANHGYLPHDGRNLTLHHFADAVTAALNVDPSFGTVPASAFSRDTGKTYFDLHDLHQPGVLQHIASLSRDDLNAKWDNTKPAPHRVAALLGDSQTDHLDVKSIAKSRLRLEALSKPATLTIREHLLCFIESSLVLMTMNEKPIPSILSFPSFGVWAAPKGRVNVFLSEERFPVELGWKRSERRIKAVDLLPIGSGIFIQYWSLTISSLWKSWVAPGFVGHEEL